MTEAYDVFISFVREDANFAESLSKYLIERGVQVLTDKSSVYVGESIVDAMEKAIEQAKYVLVLMSSAYFNSQWASQEWQIAMAYESEHNQVKLIPILLEECEIPLLLATKQYADFRNQSAIDRSLPELLYIIQQDISSADVEGVVSFGSISTDVESSELRAMIEDLQSKVDAFIQGTDGETNVAEEEYSQPDARRCFVVMPFGSEELNDMYEYFVKPS